MPGQGRRGQRNSCRPAERRSFVMATTVLVGLVMLTANSLSNFSSNSLCAQTIDWQMPAKWHQDAELNDLCVIDAETAWIVGDRGTVLRTRDAGRSWDPVTLRSDAFDLSVPPIQCRLESVTFVSANEGWIAGGYTLPDSTTSKGILFSTKDGGNTWKRIQGISLPSIKKIFFSSTGEGVAIGDGNVFKPAGVFQTRDGGISWSAAAEGKIHHWRTGSHSNGVTTLTGYDGRLGRYENHRLSDAAIIDTKAVQLREMQMVDQSFGFAVGDNNSLLQTKNGGLSWNPVGESTGLPNSPFDFHSLTIQGNRIWLAGNPGTRLYTRLIQGGDTQETWQHVELPINATMNRIRFANDLVGWAISRSGDVVHTSDGGRSWSVQRRGTRGVALLQISGRADEFIPEFFSRYCSDEDYVGAAMLLKTTATDRPDVPFTALHQSLSRVGVSFVEDRDFTTVDDPAEPILEFLVRQVRILQPRVIAVPSGRVIDEPLSVRTMVLQATQMAADPDQFRSHVDELGLNPWQVGKVVVLDRGEVANLKISPVHYMMNYGALITDHTMPSRMLLGQNPIEPRSISITTIFTSPFAVGPNNSLFGEIRNTDGNIPQRKGRANASGNMAQMRQLVGKRKTLEQLMDRTANVASTEIWNRQLNDLTRKLDDAAAGVWLFELASRCDSQGETALAAETHLYLTGQYRLHPMSVASFRWLYNHYASTEQAHIAIQSSRIKEAAEIEARILDSIDGDTAPLQSRPVKKMVDGIEVVVWELVDDPRKAASKIPTTDLTAEQEQQIYRRRYQQARATGQMFAQFDDTALDFDRNRLAKIGLNQKIDPLVPVENQLKRIVANYESSVADMAMSELAIIRQKSPGTESGMSVPNQVDCLSTATPPFLDGDLNEEVWKQADQNASSIPLISPVQHRGGVASEDRMWISSDDEYLYMAVRCRKSINGTYESTSIRRTRDSLLADSDRVEIAIDIDRDYQTCFLFSVDSNGRLADSFGNNLAWNPTWYVANRIQDDHWIAEIAIPLAEVSQHGDSWAIGACRHVRDRLVSSSWHVASSEPSNRERQPSMPTFQSLHQSVTENPAALHVLPLQAFRLVRMPWADGRVAEDSSGQSTGQSNSQTNGQSDVEPDGAVKLKSGTTTSLPPDR